VRSHSPLIILQNNDGQCGICLRGTIQLPKTRGRAEDPKFSLTFMSWPNKVPSKTCRNRTLHFQDKCFQFVLTNSQLLQKPPRKTDVTFPEKAASLPALSAHAKPCPLQHRRGFHRRIGPVDHPVSTYTCATEP